MRKSVVGFVLSAMLFALCLPAEAQQPKKVPSIGFLSLTSPETSVAKETFRRGLRDLGWVEGQNIVIEWRWAEGKRERLSELATELVRAKVQAIVALSNPEIHAAKEATSTIPIVMRTPDDPVRAGLIASLARPGGNITGLTGISTELSSKRLELLKETVPKVSRVAVLWNPSEPAKQAEWEDTQAAGQALGVTLQSLEVRRGSELESAFQAATRQHAGALIALPYPMFFGQRRQIAKLAIQARLPAIFQSGEFAEAGGLMTYGPSLADMHRRAATYVDKILKGAKPADLPVERPMKFELVINLKAAKQIGLTIPPNVLARADKVIK